MVFDEIVQRAKAGKYFAKNRYYWDVLKAIEQDVILSYESAAEYWEMTSGSFGVDVTVYSTVPLPAPFAVHLVESFDGIEFVESHGIKVATLNRTVNDLLASDDVDQQIILETIGTYYYDHGKSFDGLHILPENLRVFDEMKDDAIHYWSI